MIEFILALTWWQAAVGVIAVCLTLFLSAFLLGAACYFGVATFIWMCDWFN